MMNNPYSYSLKEAELRAMRGKKIAIIPLHAALAAYQTSAEISKPAKLVVYA